MSGYNNGDFHKDENPLQKETTKNKSRVKHDKNDNIPDAGKSMVGLVELFSYADGLDIFLVIVSLLCALANGIGLPLMIMLFGRMTDSFVMSGQKNIPDTANSSISATAILKSSLNTTENSSRSFGLEDEVARLACYIVAIGAAVFALSLFQVWAALVAAARQMARIRHKFFYAILHQEMAWFDIYKTGSLNTRLTDDINTIHGGLGDKISIFVQYFSSFLSGIIIGFVKGWKLTLVILSVSPLIGISAAIGSKLLAKLTVRELSAYAKAGAVAEEILTAIRTVVAFNGQQKALERYDANLQDARTVGMKKTLSANISVGLTQCLIFTAYALGLWYGTKLTVDEPDNYTIGTVVTIFFAVLMGCYSLGQAAPNLESIANARGAAYEVYRIIQKARPIDSGSKDGYKPDKLIGCVEFKDVHFSYPARPDVPILKGLNLTVDTGKTIALVGASGCGKSTTIQLLQRFYDPLQGEISVDGHDIRTLNVKWLRENIGVVSQEPILFSTTIAENIRYGREDVTDAEIERAVKEANAYDFISKLPDKLKTMVGERGAQLSGGQKQRIAIARALVRNPKILLLDEATSALDTQSEAVVQAALDKARTGRTTIVIAHRLSTVRTADVIAGFDNGVIAEQGSHSDLMSKRGVYYSLVMQQGQSKQEAEEHEYQYSDDPDNDDNDDDQKINILHEYMADEAGEPNMDTIRRESTRRKSSEPIRRKICFKRRKSKKAKGPKLEQEVLPPAPFLRLLSLNKPEWCFILLGVIASAIAGGIYPAFAIIVGKMIGAFKETDGTKRSAQTALLSLMFFILGIISLTVYVIMGYMFGKSGENLTMRLRSKSFKALLRQEIGFFDDYKNAIGVLLTRLATDASQVKGVTGSRLSLFTLAACTLSAAIIIAFIHSWQLTLLILASLPLMIGANVIRMKSMSGTAEGDQKAMEDVGRISAESVANIRTVVALTREDAFYDRFVKSLQVPYRIALMKAPMHGILYGISQCVIFLVLAAVYRFGAWLVANGHLQFQNVFIVHGVIMFGARSVGQSSSYAPDFGKAKVSAQRIFQLLDRQPLIDSYSEEGERVDEFEGNIEFKDTTFAYPTRPNVQVLQGLNIRVAKGQTLALVGSSGCGKTTTIQLLERFYHPASGQVLADGQDTKSLNLRWFRNQLGIVSQEPILFDCSIAENIQYGDNSRLVTQEEVEAAAKAANIQSFIEQLPEKYNTRVGDKGAQLSGGQKQRIAIARALVRKPKVLLLDEATSALDTESEKVVQKALDNARLGRTCIIIAHRLSTVQNADIIAVIQNGRVVEQGIHSELLAKQGIYYRLVNAQISH